MQLNRLFSPYRFIFLAAGLSLIVCLMPPHSAWAEASNPASFNKTNSAVPDDVSKLMNDYRYQTAYKRVEALLSQESINEQTGKNLLHRIERESITHSKANIQTAYQLSRQYGWEEAEILLSVLSTQVLDKEPVEVAKKEIARSQNRQLLKVESNTALQKQSWLRQQNELNQLNNRSTQRKMFSRTKKYWLDFKLDRHNRYLLKLARQNLEFEEYSMSQLCLNAIEPEELTVKDKDQFDMLADLTHSHTSTSTARKETPKIKQKPANSVSSLTNSLEENMQKNDLLEIKFNLDELALITSSQSLHKTLVDQAETYLKNEIVKLDQAADDLYRTEQPLEAYEIWELLLELDSSNAAIQQKFDRAEIVLNNMKALRAQGNNGPLPDIQ